MPEDLAPVRRADRGALVLSNVVERRHGVHVEVGRLPLGQLDAGDAQRPDVHLAGVLPLVHRQDHLGRHPVRCPHETVGRRRDGGRAEVGQLDDAAVGQQDVARLDVPVDAALEVQVRQAGEAAGADGRNLLLEKWGLVHFDDVRSRPEAVLHNELK